MKMRKQNIILAVIGVVLLCFCLAACNEIPPGRENTDKGGLFVTLDFDASVEMLLDENDAVLSVQGSNTQAQILLFDEGGIVGSQLDVAIDNILSLAATYGYFADCSATVGITAFRTDGGNEYDRVSALVQNSAQKYNLTLDVSDNENVNLVYSAELTSLRAANPKYREVSPSKYRLIKRAVASSDDITFDTAVDMPTADLFDCVRKVWSDSKAKYGHSYIYPVIDAQLSYDLEYGYLRGKTYLDAIIQKFNNPETQSDKFDYAITQFKRFTLDSVILCYLKYVIDIEKAFFKNPFLFDETAKSVFEKLAPFTDDGYGQFVKKACDLDGNVDRENLTCYMEQIYRNSDGEQQRTLRAVYSQSIAPLLASPESFSGEIEYAIKRAIPDTRNIIDEMIKDYPSLQIALETFYAIFLDGFTADLDKLNGLISQFTENLTGYLVQAGLSEEEIEWITQHEPVGTVELKDAHAKTLAAQKQYFEDLISSFKNENNNK